MSNYNPFDLPTGHGSAVTAPEHVGMGTLAAKHIRDWVNLRTNTLAALFICPALLWFAAGCASEKSEPKPALTPPKAQVEQAKPAEPAPNPPPQSSASAQLKQAAAKPSAPWQGEGWQSMFDGQTLTGWSETKFAGHGEVESESGLILLKMGDPFTGINYTNDFPKMDYELGLDAMRVSGSDFFCGLTVPVGDSFCSLIVGGWGGSLVGISSLDHMDASENETTKYLSFEQNKWYRIRLRITQGRIEGWIDNDKLINVLTTGRQISLRPGEIEMSKPMGIACWQTSAALREIKVRRVDKPEGPPQKY